ncbi:MAG: hypothetical protein SH819_08485 [Cytophagales bacterium]|nr:hypothetical protein [Cytophagales bacterium]
MVRFHNGWVIVFGVLISLTIGLQAYLYLSRPISQEELAVRASVMPSLTLTSMDGSAFPFRQDANLLLIYFNSECDHCQREVAEIHRNMHLFSKTDVLFMSSQPLPPIVQFASGFDFKQYPRAHFVRIAPEDLAKAFGAIAVPQVFIYSQEGKLITLFSGETSAQVIAASLP